MFSHALEHVAISVPKAGHAAGENEDAHASTASRFAVADGASEGWASGPWAAALAAAYVAGPPEPDTLADWLTAARSAFAPPPAATSWYAEAKQAQGAFSTLLGLTVEPAADGGLKWRAVAVGDSCLFQVRGGNLRAAFPVEDVSGFTNRPRLVGSAAGAPEADWFAGRADPGDVFYLLTDALAEWFLRTVANGQSWAELDRVTAGQESFAGWVKSRRADRTIKNDDTTAMRIAILGDGVTSPRR